MGQLRIRLERCIGMGAYSPGEVHASVRVVLLGCREKWTHVFESNQAGSDPEWPASASVSLNYPGAEAEQEPILWLQVFNESKNGGPPSVLGAGSVPLRQMVQFPDRHNGERHVLLLARDEESNAMSPAGKVRIHVSFITKDPPHDIRNELELGALETLGYALGMEEDELSSPKSPLKSPTGTYHTGLKLELAQYQMA